MTFLTEHIWKILIIIAVAFGAHHYRQRSLHHEKWENATVSYGKLAEKIRSTQPATSAIPEWEEDYWRLMLKTHEAKASLEANKITPPHVSGQSTSTIGAEGRLREFIREASKNTRYPKDKKSIQDPAILLLEVIIENYNILADHGVWQNPKVRDALAQGEAPTVPEGEFEGEKLRLVRRISPYLYRNGITDPCNIIILPESAAALYFPDVDDSMDNFATRLNSCGLLDENAKLTLRGLYLENTNQLK